MKRQVRFFTLIILIALIAVAACVQSAEPGQTTAISTVTSSLSPTATPTPLRENLAVLGSGSGSDKNEFARLAIDGDLDSLWNSEKPATQPKPQWFSVVLDDTYLVDKIEMVVTQAPAGPTTHEVRLGNGSGRWILYKRLTDVHTEDGQTLEVAIEPPQIVNEVLILTLLSQGWLAWREVRVFGSPSVKPMEIAKEPLLQLNRITAGLELPVQVTHAGDSSGRLFVVEQKGRIHIIRNGVVNDTPFLDISERISCCLERGLIGIAFPPAFAAKQHFYVTYTDPNGTSIISRYKTSADPDRTDADSEEILLTIDQPDNTHNVGTMAFGPQDGYLYIGSGDGGGFDNMGNGQDPNTLLGKILRIDVESGVKPYSIPASNPFTQVEGYRGEIWALGLRNPWGFAFDKQTGDLYIPDVGFSIREEVNYQPASSAGGENYGWPIMEGNICPNDRPWPCSWYGLTYGWPVVAYDHSQGCAVVGGAVYRGTRYPDMQGLFIYADFCSGRIWGLKRPDQDLQNGWQDTLLLNASIPLSSIGEDEKGNVYVTGYQDGVVYMLTKK